MNDSLWTAATSAGEGDAEVGTGAGTHPLVAFETGARRLTPMVEPRMTLGVTGNGDLRLVADIDMPASSLRIPAPRAPGVADELWKQTCFEVFIQGEDAPAYVEFNFSPSGQWAAYRFSDYRRDGTPLPTPDPAIHVEAGDTHLTLSATLSSASVPPGATLRVGLTAVLEDSAGSLSYWALTHVGDRPDFHRADSFSLELKR